MSREATAQGDEPWPQVFTSFGVLRSLLTQPKYTVQTLLPRDRNVSPTGPIRASVPWDFVTEATSAAAVPCRRRPAEGLDGSGGSKRTS